MENNKLSLQEAWKQKAAKSKPKNAKLVKADKENVTPKQSESVVCAQIAAQNCAKLGTVLQVGTETLKQSQREYCYASGSQMLMSLIVEKAR